MDIIFKLLKWDRFLAPKFLHILYYMSLALVVASLYFTLGQFFRLTELGILSFGNQLLLFITILFLHVFGVLMNRLLFEFFMVAFRVNDNIEALKKKGAL